MSTSHHGDGREQDQIRQRFIDQVLGAGRREYPGGRMGAEDDGALSFAVAADKRHGTVVIHFGKPVTWIGLRKEDCERLVAMLEEKMMELRGIVPVDKENDR